MKSEMLVKLEEAWVTANTVEGSSNESIALGRVLAQCRDRLKFQEGVDLTEKKVAQCAMLVLTGYRLALPQVDKSSLPNILAQMEILDKILNDYMATQA